jgi:hypothetical protein
MKEEEVEQTRWREKEEDLHHTPVAGSSCRDPASGLARGFTRGSQSVASSPIEADQIQTARSTRVKPRSEIPSGNPRQTPEKFGPNSKNSRMKTTNQILQSPICPERLHRIEDEFSLDTWWSTSKEKRSGNESVGPGGTGECVGPGGTGECVGPGGAGKCVGPGGTGECVGPGGTGECSGPGGKGDGDSNSPVAGSSWGNPPSGLAQGYTRGSPTSPNFSDKADQIQIRRLERPRQLSGNGKSFLRCSPLAAKFRLGSASSTSDEVPGLTDVCSNVGLIDKALLEKYYPGRSIFPTRRKISGVGETTTMGFTVIPVWLECRDDATNGRILAEFDVELHVLESFAPGLLIGLDAIRDYGIDIMTSKMQGCIDGLSFPLFSTAAPKLQAVKVFSDKRMVVPGRSTVPIPVHTACMEGIDYIFSPYLTAELSIPTAPQMPRAIIDSQTRFIMFSNHSEHPMRIEKRQVLGDAEAVLFGTVGAATSHVIRWDDLIQPRQSGHSSIGLKAPTTVAMEELLEKEIHELTIFHITGATAHTDQYAYEDELRFDTLGREIPRKRSLPETTIRLIASTAEKRSAGAQFPENHLEDADVAFPSLPADEGKTISWKISEDLDPEQVAELVQLLTEFGDVFSDGLTIGQVKQVLATINTGDGDLPPAARLRPIGPAKRQVVDQALSQMEQWDVIERSNSPTASAVVLVWQNNKWRFCVDFRQLNKVTIKDCYPMLRSDYIFSSLTGKRFFSALDAVKGYHQVEIAEQDRYKTAFITHRGLFQFKRMPFGLRNAPAQFQRMMDTILGSLRWEAALCYIDDVLVFSDTWEQHIAHLRRLFTSCRDAGLMFSKEKCRFAFSELRLLGLGLGRYGMFTLDDKVKAITDLAAPQTLGELYRLLGMFGYYRGFIRNYAKITRPLELLKRSTQSGVDYNSKRPIAWSDDAQAAFEELKKRLCSAPILAHPKFDGRPFVLYTDASAEAFGAVLTQQWTAEDYETDSADSMKNFHSTSVRDWETSYTSDPVFRSVYHRLQSKETSPSTIGYTLRSDGTLHYRTSYGDRVCLPKDMIVECLKLAHDALGHFGVDKTYDRVTATYYRPGLSTIVADYVKHCHECGINKTARRRPFGSLLSIDPPYDRIPRAFESINMDLIVGLPKSGGYDAVLTVVDRFTKAVIFAPTTSDFTAASLADTFFEHVVSRGFLPTKFITDRDPRIIQSFWKSLTSRLGIDHRKTAAYHAQADGAAERANQTLEVALRAYVNQRQNNWHRYLGLIQLAYNTAKHPGTGFSPNELLYANPMEPMDRLLHPTPPTEEEDERNEHAEDFLDGVSARLQDAQQAIIKALSAQKAYYDRRHSELPDIAVGDFVSIRLDLHPVSIVKRNKLSQQKLPPFRVVKIHSSGRAVELDIPSNLSIHPIVSVQHVEKAQDPAKDPFDRYTATSSMLRIVDSRISSRRPGRKEYLLRRGDDRNSDTWSLTPPAELLSDFEERNAFFEAIQAPYTIVDHRTTRQGTRYRVSFGDNRNLRWITEDAIDHHALNAYKEKPQVHVTTPTDRHGVDEPFESRKPRPGEKLERPILYIARQTTGGEPLYESTEREVACLYWAVNKLSLYLEGNTFTVFTDHESTRDVLQAAPNVKMSKRLDKYRMLLQPYLDNMDVVYRPGKQMQMVDPLSRARYKTSAEQGSSSGAAGGA